MAKQVPSVGRVVHFVYGDKHLAAMITDPEFRIIDPGPSELAVGQALVVFPAMQPSFITVAAVSPSGEDGTWHWPEYVPAKD
jgi:hypothetical protein